MVQDELRGFTVIIWESLTHFFWDVGKTPWTATGLWQLLHAGSFTTRMINAGCISSGVIKQIIKGYGYGLFYSVSIYWSFLELTIQNRFSDLTSNRSSVIALRVRHNNWTQGLREQESADKIIPQSSSAADKKYVLLPRQLLAVARHKKNPALEKRCFCQYNSHLH